MGSIVMQKWGASDQERIRSTHGDMPCLSGLKTSTLTYVSDLVMCRPNSEERGCCHPLILCGLSEKISQKTFRKILVLVTGLAKLSPSGRDLRHQGVRAGNVGDDGSLTLLFPAAPVKVTS
jgi:hypothetical protein